VGSETLIFERGETGREVGLDFLGDLLEEREPTGEARFSGVNWVPCSGIVVILSEALGDFLGLPSRPFPNPYWPPFKPAAELAEDVRREREGTKGAVFGERVEKVAVDSCGGGDGDVDDVGEVVGITTCVGASSTDSLGE